MYNHIDTVRLFRYFWFVNVFVEHGVNVLLVIVLCHSILDGFHVYVPCRRMNLDLGLRCCGSNGPHNHFASICMPLFQLFSVITLGCSGASFRCALSGILALFECLSVNYYAFGATRYYYERSL